MEIWKEIKGYEGMYEVSSFGRVKGLNRKVIHSSGKVLIKKEKTLKPNISTGGYLRVSLSKKGKVKYKKIHQLVAIAFLRHNPCGMKLVVDHINTIKTDNRLDNLQVITQRENSSKDKKGSSKYTGVRYVKANKKWRSQIIINGKYNHLGYFTKEEEASEAYQTALKGLLCTKY